MTAPDVIDVEGTDVQHELVARPAALAVTPTVQAGELVARLDVIRQAMQQAMTEGVDYGRIPGVDKPTLFKPGAEKLGVLFQLDIQFESVKTWGPGEHLTVETSATVYHAPTGTRLGKGEGLATTREKKHAKRKQERTCPACGVAAIIKGKQEYGGGWVCFRKKNGCNAKFTDGDPAIEGQAVCEVENPELPDAWNNVVKMATKRARVDAVLAVTGASALFTQDAEDMGPAEPLPPPWWVGEVKALVRKSKVTTKELRILLRGTGLDVAEDANPGPLVDSLTGEQAKVLIDVLKRQPVPTGESDVPAAEPGEFEHPKDDDREPVPFDPGVPS